MASFALSTSGSVSRLLAITARNVGLLIAITIAWTLLFDPAVWAVTGPQLSATRADPISDNRCRLVPVPSVQPQNKVNSKGDVRCPPKLS